MVRVLMMVTAAVLALSACAEVLAPPVELVEGLRTGQIYAQFVGGGDLGVSGRIERGEGGPSSVYVAPGTQFWAQQPGFQGQSSLGSTSVNLAGRRFSQVWIPTACTNLNLAAPTEKEVMVAFPCPNPDMALLADSVPLGVAPRPAIQVAVWAIANDPPKGHSVLLAYVNGQSAASQGRFTPAGIFQSAAKLLADAGLAPERYRLFR